MPPTAAANVLHTQRCACPAAAGAIREVFSSAALPLTSRHSFGRFPLVPYFSPVALQIEMEPGWKPVQPQDLPHVLQRPKTGGDPCLVIDARDTSAYVEAHIDGAINVPVPTFTPRSGAEFGHMYSLTQLESDLEPKAARKFLGRKGRRVLIYDDGAQGTESGKLFSSSTKSRVTTKPTFSFAPANRPNMLRMHPHLQHAFHAYSPHLHSHRPHAAHAAPAGRRV